MSLLGILVARSLVICCFVSIHYSHNKTAAVSHTKRLATSTALRTLLNKDAREGCLPVESSRRHASGDHFRGRSLLTHEALHG